jgi:Zn-dependent protease with chaperone function
MSAPTVPGTQQSCPECAAPLVSEYDLLPWCEKCEWNLSTPDLDPLLSRTERWRARFAHSVAYDMTRNLFAGLVGRSAERPRRGGGYVVLVLISVLVLAIFAGSVGFGLWLVVTGNWLIKIVGLLLIAFAMVFRPTLGSPRKVLEYADELTEAEAPTLFRLVRRTAEAIGSPMPHTIALNGDFNAMAGIVGVRRRRLLLLGLPMLAVLRPQERVALIGHELGHFINRDSRRSVATQPALTAFGTAARLLDQRGLRSVVHDPSYAGGFAWFAMSAGTLILTPFLYVASQLLWLCHLGVNMIGARVAQRAEYFADDLAARAGGSEAASSEMDVYVDILGITTIIGARSRNQERADGWREGVEKSRDSKAARIQRLRQLTIRTESGIFASHPPTGLRHRMIQAAPYRTAAVVLTVAESAAIDAELARYEERYRREIASAGW